jgi:hypothetical protein
LLASVCAMWPRLCWLTVVQKAIGTISLGESDVARRCTALRHARSEDGQAEEEAISTCPRRGEASRQSEVGVTAAAGGCGRGLDGGSHRDLAGLLLGYFEKTPGFCRSEDSITRCAQSSLGLEGHLFTTTARLPYVYGDGS